MATLGKKRTTLTDGKGKCSVPMQWGYGAPAGFCDNEAYGERPEGETFRNARTGEEMRHDGKYAGYVPGLACAAHGGPTKEEAKAKGESGGGDMRRRPTQFTGGEWTVGNKNWGAVVTDDVAESRGALVEAYGGHPICESIANEDDRYLIAAAKDMYEALEAMCDRFKPSSGHGPGADGDRKVHEQAREALAKAKGESGGAI